MVLIVVSNPTRVVRGENNIPLYELNAINSPTVMFPLLTKVILRNNGKKAAKLMIMLDTIEIKLLYIVIVCCKLTFFVTEDLYSVCAILNKLKTLIVTRLKKYFVCFLIGFLLSNLSLQKEIIFLENP